MEAKRFLANHNADRCELWDGFLLWRGNELVNLFYRTFNKLHVRLKHRFLISVKFPAGTPGMAAAITTEDRSLAALASALAMEIVRLFSDKDFDYHPNVVRYPQLSASIVRFLHDDGLSGSTNVFP